MSKDSVTVICNKCDEHTVFPKRHGVGKILDLLRKCPKCGARNKFRDAEHLQPYDRS